MQIPYATKPVPVVARISRILKYVRVCKAMTTLWKMRLERTRGSSERIS